MVERANRGKKCHANHQYPNTNEKAKDYDKNEKSSYHNY